MTTTSLESAGFFFHSAKAHAFKISYVRKNRLGSHHRGESQHRGEVSGGSALGGQSSATSLYCRITTGLSALFSSFLVFKTLYLDKYYSDLQLSTGYAPCVHYLIVNFTDTPQICRKITACIISILKIYQESFSLLP